MLLLAVVPPLLLRACVGCVWVCVSVRPGFSIHVSGWGAACSAGLLLFARRAGERVPGYIVLFLLLRRCDALLLCLEAGTLGHTPPLGNGVAWPMEVEVGIFSSCMDGYGEWAGGLGLDWTDEGHRHQTETEGEPAPRRGGSSAEVSRRRDMRSGVLARDPSAPCLWSGSTGFATAVLVRKFSLDVAPASGGGSKCRFLLSVARWPLRPVRYVWIRSFPPPTSLMQASMNVDWWLARLGISEHTSKIDDCDWVTGGT